MSATIEQQDRGIGGFHIPESVQERDEDLVGGETRSFQGSGGHTLKVPGLKEIFAIRIGTMRVPLIVKLELPENAGWQDRPKTYSMEQNMFQVIGEDGQEELLRCIGSNDGVFQANETFHITGRWSAPKAKSAKQDAKE